MPGRLNPGMIHATTGSDGRFLMVAPTLSDAYVITATHPSFQDQHTEPVVGLFEQSAPSVAYITTETVQRGTFGGAEVSQGAGSGFVWDAAGHVVTNFHVVKGARRVFVRLDAGKPIEIFNELPPLEIGLLDHDDRDFQ